MLCLNEFGIYGCLNTLFSSLWMGKSRCQGNWKVVASKNMWYKQRSYLVSIIWVYGWNTARLERAYVVGGSEARIGLVAESWQVVSSGRAEPQLQRRSSM